MIDTIYIEKAVADHPRVKTILARFPKALTVSVERYQEVFNHKSQDFRLQKKNPALILASKHQGHVLAAPEEYGIAEGKNYYFSHMLNCLYDCRYCFLQGMYRSANYVLFVNFEDFADAMDVTAEAHSSEPVWFFSGYDCDSLALEPVTGFASWCLDYFAQRPNQYLELRTKSTQVRSLLAREPLNNVVVAFSLSPEELCKALEHKAPALERRLQAMQKLQQAGWLIGVRLDPLIFSDNYQELYLEFMRRLDNYIDWPSVHSVSLGVFRLPKDYFKSVQRLYPAEKLFAAQFETRSGMVSYPQTREKLLMQYSEDLLLQRINADQYFPCYEELRA